MMNQYMKTEASVMDAEKILLIISNTFLNVTQAVIQIRTFR